MARKEIRKEEAGKMSVEEAGKRGGEATKETHGHEFYREIGKKGGEERAREIREEGISQEEITSHTRRPIFVEVPIGVFAGQKAKEQKP